MSNGQNNNNNNQNNQNNQNNESGSDNGSDDDDGGGGDDDDDDDDDDNGLTTLVSRTHLKDFPFCGERKSPTRVVGGAIFSPHEYPGMCSLQFRGNALCVDVHAMEKDPTRLLNLRA